ncbi:MAG: PTS sugar transporter subunit IIA [Erysipelothrix sp.]|nr:PTS sugar transporter subunit IIA [Erysipelothrix sp.]
MEVVKLENIQIVDEVSNWEESVQRSGQLLVDSGFVEPSYIDAIFESTKVNGPYYVLAPEIAMPHASGDSGVKASQISLLIVKKPFKFSEEGFDVRLVFTLASADSESHLGFLRSLSELFSNDEDVQKLISSETPTEAYELLQNIK